MWENLQKNLIKYKYSQRKLREYDKIISIYNKNFTYLLKKFNFQIFQIIFNYFKSFIVKK